MRLRLVLLICLLTLGCASSGSRFSVDLIEGEIEEGLPEGWELGGPGKRAFTVGIDRSIVAQGTQSATLYSASAERGMATLKQTIRARGFAGERVRFRAHVRHIGLEDWAGLWMRADSDREQAIAFDNMANRRLKGSADWSTYDVVLHIPKSARVLHVGVLLIGRGQLWIDDASLEVVNESVPLTARHREGFPIQSVDYTINPSPRNLDFEQD